VLKVTEVSGCCKPPYGLTRNVIFRPMCGPILTSTVRFSSGAAIERRIDTAADLFVELIRAG
jgi:hypothetical protein